MRGSDSDRNNQISTNQKLYISMYPISDRLKSDVIFIAIPLYFVYGTLEQYDSMHY